MKVLVERHNHETECSHKFKCMKCGSELEYTSSDIVNGWVVPPHATKWDARAWKIDVLGVQCPICNKWYVVDKNYNIEPVSGNFVREHTWR